MNRLQDRDSGCTERTFFAVLDLWKKAAFPEEGVTLSIKDLQRVVKHDTYAKKCKLAAKSNQLPLPGALDGKPYGDRQIRESLGWLEGRQYLKVTSAAGRPSAFGVFDYPIRMTDDGCGYVVLNRNGLGLAAREPTRPRQIDKSRNAEG
jgi:hypothetical protein